MSSQDPKKFNQQSNHAREISDMMSPDVTYVWMKPKTVGGITRLITPWCDGFEHEHPFNYVFESREEALEGLEIYNAKDDADSEKWILCRMTVAPLEIFSR